MKVSVIIPCHNAEPYVGETIRSVLAQTRWVGRPEQVIVVDDGSTDRSLEIAKSFGDLVRVESKRSGNAAATRNYGVTFADGDALMFLDADDVLGPTALAALVAELERDPTAIAACPWFRLELVNGQWERRPPTCWPRRRGDDPLAGWLRGWYHPPCSVLWSREAFDAIGGWDETVRVNQDGDVMMRAFVRGTPLRLTSDGEAFYRRIPAEISSISGKRNTLEGLRSRLDVLTRIAESLEQREALDLYRPALADAFDLIIADCGGQHPALRAEAKRQRRQYGDSEAKRLARTLERRLRARYFVARSWYLEQLRRNGRTERAEP